MDSNIENVENLLKYSKCGMEEFIKEDKIDYSKIPINIINQYRDDLLSKGIFTGNYALVGFMPVLQPSILILSTESFRT